MSDNDAIQEFEVLSEHSSEEEARTKAHSLIRLMNGVPAGWAMAIMGDNEEGYRLVRYQVNP